MPTKLIAKQKAPAANTRARRPAPKALLGFPQRVKDQLKKQGMNQADLAGRLGMNRGQVSQLLSGSNVAGVQAAMIIRVADALEVDAGWLLTGRGTPEGVNTVVLVEGTAAYDAAIAALKRR